MSPSWWRRCRGICNFSRVAQQCKTLKQKYKYKYKIALFHLITHFGVSSPFTVKEKKTKVQLSMILIYIYYIVYGRVCMEVLYM